MVRVSPLLKKMYSNGCDLREMAVNVCKDYLHGPWKHVNKENIRFKRISGGLSNFLYHVSLPEELQEEYRSNLNNNYKNTAPGYKKDLLSELKFQETYCMENNTKSDEDRLNNLENSILDTFKKSGDKLSSLEKTFNCLSHLEENSLKLSVLENKINSLEVAASTSSANSSKVFRSRSNSDSSTSVLSDSTSESSVPNEVLIRIYGQVHGEHVFEHLITESVIFALLSERKIGPKLYGVFPGGRIEQYLNARALTTDELSIPIISTQIARKTAALHNMDVPISKEPTWIWTTSKKWLQTVENCLAKGEKFNEYNEQILKIKNYDLKNELFWLESYLRSIDSPVVFCHNDLQEGNILMMLDEREDDDNLILIDFEYCSYNYRGFDLANHFLEWTYDYTNKSYPYFHEYPEKYPTKEQQLLFINEYLSVSDHVCKPEDLLKEVEAFSLASHLFWGLWSCANAPLTQIMFGYWDYAITRFERYFELKRKIIESHDIKRLRHETD